jgi:DNA-binding NarL/FixJ family response regulator
MIKLILAEDQIIVREGIKRLLQEDEEIDIVGCAGNGSEALELCDAFNPEIVLMDINMPVCDGVEGTKLIKQKHPSIKILILTMYNDDDNICRAMENGADGYVLKGIKPEDLIGTIKKLVNGLNVVDESVLTTIMEKYKCSKKNQKVSDMIKKSEKNMLNNLLNDTEKEIIKYIVYSKNNREIADLLHLSEGRVRNIITRIFKKLNVKDRTQLAVYAVKKDII